MSAISRSFAGFSSGLTSSIRMSAVCDVACGCRRRSWSRSAKYRYRSVSVAEANGQSAMYMRFPERTM